MGLLKGAELGGRKKDPSIEQPGEDSVKVKGKSIFLGNRFRHLMKGQGMVKRLKKQIPAVKGALLLFGNERRLLKGDKNRSLLFFFFLVQLFNILPGPFIGIGPI